MVDVDPRDGMDAVRKIRQFHDEYGIVAVSSFPAGCMTPINAAPYYPVYATCAELGLPIFLTAGVPGPRVPLEPQRVELPRRGLLVLPRADRRHAPRRRSVDRARGEADAQVAEPLLLDLSVRPEALPGADHPLREHPRRRQDHLRGLLPGRTDLRADHVGAAERAAQGRGLAEVPPRNAAEGAGPRRD